MSSTAISLACLASLQEFHGGLLGQQERGGEVVGGHALHQEIPVVRRRLVAQDVVAQGLQQHRTGVVIAAGVLREVNSAVLKIRHRAGGMRQIAHMVEAESEVPGDVRDDVLGQRTARVAHRGQDLLRLGLVLREVVVPLPHHGAQLTVGAAGLLRRRHLLVQPAFQLVLQPHHGLQHIHRKPRTDADFRQVQGLVEGAALVAFQLDFQRRAAAGRLGAEQLVDADAQRRGELLEQAELGLALAVFDQAQLARGGPDGGAQVIEREAGRLAQMADAAAHADDVHLGRGGRRRGRKLGGSSWSACIS